MWICKRIPAMLLIAASLSFCLGFFASAEDSRADKQRAIVETAIAYYLNGPDQQYDSTPLSEDYDRDSGGNLRHAHYVAPEDATPDQTTYSVCSEFCFEVIYNALGYKIMNDPRHSVTKYMQDESKGPVVVHQFDNRGVSEEEADAQAEAAWKKLQPGDVVVDCTYQSKSSGGHAMLFVGDIDGDGLPEILHSGGKKYNMETGLDQVEKKGTVMKASAESYFHTKDKGRYFGQRGKYTILRVIDDPDQPTVITPSARTRMKYPWMRSVHTVSTGCYGAVELGGTLTYTLTVYNHNKEQDFKDVPVRYVVPEGTELIEASGATVEGRNLSWTVDIPQGESKTFTIQVKVNAPLGTEIVSDGGKVGEIPMKVLTTVVGGSRKGLEQLEDYTLLNKKFSGEKGVSGTGVINSIYRCGMGVELGIPDAGTLFDTLCTDAKIPDHTLYTLRDDYRSTALGKMVVRHWIGGRKYTARDTKERVQETRLKDLQAGDVIVVAWKFPVRDSSTNVYYYNGYDLIGYGSGRLRKADAAEIEKLLSRPFFVALRPVQAYEDLSARNEAAQKFTDVKREDWYYSYVSALAADGTISGTTATTFTPNGNLTFGQALKLITLAVGEKEQAKTGEHWASGYLTLAKSKGWIDADVDPDGKITRVQFCRIAAKAKGITDSASFNPFTDTDDPAVLALHRAGVINGVSAAEFRPDGLLTRAQIAKIIWTLRNV